MHAFQSISRLRSLSLSALLATSLAGGFAFASAAPAQAATSTYLSVSVMANGKGYATINAATGVVTTWGVKAFPTSPTGFSGLMVSISVTADGQGYVAMSSTGQMYAYGTAAAFTNPPASSYPYVGVSISGNGQGWAAVTSHGDVTTRGNVANRGSAGIGSTGIVGISTRSDGLGYVAVSKTGQIYARNVTYHAPAGYQEPVAGIAVNSSGSGYMVMTNAGKFFAYGVTGHTNPPATTTMTSVAITPNGVGALAMSTTGQMYAYSPVVYQGNANPITPDPRLTVAQEAVNYAQWALHGGSFPAILNGAGWAGGPIPYVTGGGHGQYPGPTSGGLDCGGFTRWMYAFATNPDTDVLNFSLAAYQEDNPHFTLVVAPSVPVPGDLVVFTTPPDTHSHHVAIFIGNGQMINEPGTGHFVEVAPIGHSGDIITYYHYTG